MPVTGKELEPKTEAERLAAAEVESYIEKIEKKVETKPPVQGNYSSVPTTNQSLVNDAAAKVMAMGPKAQKQTIVLPLDEEQVREGLHHKVIDAIRWLAEWSVYMIKKYPGRVFYRQKTNQ